MPWRDDVQVPGNVNRAADPRFSSTYVNVGRISRGMLMTEPIEGGPGTVQRFRFLTNPSEIALSYNVANDLDHTNNNVVGIAGGVIPVEDGHVSMSFSMMVDRTYEVWSGSLPEGVLHDIRQMEKVLGPPLGGSPSGGSPSGYAQALRAMDHHSRMSASGIVMRRPATVFFGGPQSFSFYGLVTSLSVSMMKFSVGMVPTRAGFQIAMESMGSGQKTEPGGSGGYDTRNPDTWSDAEREKWVAENVWRPNRERSPSPPAAGPGGGGIPQEDLNATPGGTRPVSDHHIP